MDWAIRKTTLNICIYFSLNAAYEELIEDEIAISLIHMMKNS